MGKQNNKQSLKINNNNSNISNNNKNKKISI